MAGLRFAFAAGEPAVNRYEEGGLRVQGLGFRFRRVVKACSFRTKRVSSA